MVMAANETSNSIAMTAHRGSNAHDANPGHMAGMSDPSPFRYWSFKRPIRANNRTASFSAGLWHGGRSCVAVLDYYRRPRHGESTTARRMVICERSCGQPIQSEECRSPRVSTRSTLSAHQLPIRLLSCLHTPTTLTALPTQQAAHLM